MYVEHNIPKAHNANVAFVDCGILSNLLFPPPKKKKFAKLLLWINTIKLFLL